MMGAISPPWSLPGRQELFVVVEAGEAVEPNHSVCDSAFAKPVTTSFGDTIYNLNIQYQLLVIALKYL